MTPKQIATVAMSGVRELSYPGMVVIDKSDLKTLIEEAAEQAYLEGLETGRKLGPRKKIMLSKSSRSVPEDLDQRRSYLNL